VGQGLNGDNFTAVDPANAHELAQSAEVGADVLKGAPSAGGWQFVEIDLSEYLDRYRD
jgi:hypothetical protein